MKPTSSLPPQATRSLAAQQVEPQAPPPTSTPLTPTPSFASSSERSERTAKLNGFIVEPFTFLLQDILYHAYQRSVEAGRSRKLATSDYSKLFSVSAPDISRSDNEALARSARDITQGMQSLASQLPGQSETFTKKLLRIVFKFAGEPQTEDIIDNIYRESIEYKNTEQSSNSELGEEMS